MFSPSPALPVTEKSSLSSARYPTVPSSLTVALSLKAVLEYSPDAPRITPLSKLCEALILTLASLGRSRSVACRSAVKLTPTEVLSAPAGEPSNTNKSPDKKPGESVPARLDRIHPSLPQFLE